MRQFYYNLQKGLFVIVFTALCCNLAKAQTLTLGTVDIGPYTPGSSIAVPFTVNTSSGCIKPDNVFKLYISSVPGGTPDTQIGSYTGFYATFVNGVIPAGLAPGSYNLAITSSDAPATSTTASIDIVAGTPVLAKITSNANSTPNSQYPDVFGNCSGSSGAYIFANGTPGATLTATVHDEITNTNSSLNFNPNASFSAAYDNYTIFVTATSGSTVGTRAYQLINNQVTTIFGSNSSNPVCIKNGEGVLIYKIPPDNVKNNYRGNLYTIDWGDGTYSEYTYCDLVKLNGDLPHSYTSSSCASGNANHKFTVSAGVSSKICSSLGQPITTSAVVVLQPENNFEGPNDACLNTPVTFTNRSFPGEDASSANCQNNNALYTWYVDGNPIVFDQPLNASFTYTFTTSGLHHVKLVFQSQSNTICGTDDLEKEICILAPPRPDFSLAARTICNTQTVTPTDLSYVDQTCHAIPANSAYNWTITGPQGAVTPVFINSTSPSSTQPQIKFTTPGVYTLTLSISTLSCGVVSTSQTITVDAPPTVSLSPDNPFCGINQTLIFDPNANYTKTTFAGTATDQLNTYSWTVTANSGQSAAVFTDNTTSSTKYPHILFTGFGTYTVTATQTNNCGTASDVQQITFLQAPTVSAGQDKSVCPDVPVQLQGAITGPTSQVTSITWMGGSVGNFSDIHSLTSTYTPTNAERIAGQVALTLRVTTSNPSPCDQIDANVLITIYPRNQGTNFTTSICTGNQINYQPTSSVTGSAFTWTSTATNASGNSTNSSGTSGNITDGLTNTDGLNNGTVIYTITPTANGCQGTPFTLTVTVTPRPVLSVSPTTICSGNPAGLVFNSNLNPTTYKWTSVASAGITGNSNQTIAASFTGINEALTNTNSTAGTVTYTITPVSSAGCEGTAVTITVTVQPLPATAVAGTDQQLCNETSAQLAGNNPGNSSGMWTEVSGETGYTIVSPTAYNTVVTGLQSGHQYKFRWTITGLSPCAATSSDVVIKDLMPLTNTISYNAPKVCYGQTITVSGPTSGGTGTYTYSWEISTDGTNWTPVNGASGASYSFTGTQNIYVHRLVGSLPCSSVSQPVYIEVQQPISNNIINGVPAICYNNIPAAITGSTPGGADGNYLYQWQKSEDNGTTWQSIASANGINYQPPALTITTKFQRIVSTNLCNGLQQSTSNAVTVTVAPLNTNIITSDASRSICTGATLNYHITARDANTSFTWVSSVTSGTVTGNTASGSGDISDVLVNADLNNNGTVTYIITPINNNCPAAPFTLMVTVTPLPRLTLNRTSNIICSGGTTDIIFTSNAATFKWISNASAGISGNTSQLNTISAAGINDGLINTLQTAGTVTYTITPFSATGCEGAPATVTITVQPAPIPAQAGQDDAICSAASYQLQGNNPQAFTGSWSLVSTQTGITFDNAAQYNTTVRGLQPGQNYVFRWTISGASQCAVSSDDVVINDLNDLTNTISSPNPAICFGQAVTINGDQPTGGNLTYSYSWQSSTDNGASWNPIVGQTGQNLSVTLTATTLFRRIVTSGPCSSYSNVVQIVVQPQLAGNTISANQVICYNTTPAALTGGNTLTGGDGNYIYQWQSSINNGGNWLSINSANGSAYQPSALTSTTQFRRIVSTSLCNGTQQSTSNVVTITVTPLNTNTLTSASSRIICTGTPLNYHPTARQANTVFTWVSLASANITGNSASGTGDINDVLINSDPNNNGSVTYIITPNNNNCPGTPFALTVTVTPIPQVFITNNGNQICSGSPTGITFRTNMPGVVLLKWVSDAVPGVAGNNNQYPVVATRIDDILTTTLTVPATIVYHLTPISAGGCEGQMVDATVTILPQPVQANAGPDEQICNTTGYTLKGNNPSPSTGRWTITSGQTSVGFADAAQYNTAVSGLQPGQDYTFRWTITSTGGCSTSVDEVTVNDLLPLSNNISFGNPAVCSGQTITVIGNAATGGTGSFVYTWESSTDNINWTTIAGQNGKNYSFTGTQSIYVRRIVTSGPCVLISQPVYIIVQQPITSNIIGNDQQVCYGFTPALLTGSAPAGADGNFSYQWQSSTDNGASWTNISGAVTGNYQPGSLTVSVKFRRVVTSALCTGPQQSISNAILLMVNPLAVASFTYTGDLGCIPYLIDANNIKATVAAGNNTYAWYADGVFIGSGSAFPGYTITQDDKQVVIKLIVTSKFGCPDASFTHTFSTIKEVTAGFTQDQTKGCGPLTVAFTNTSNPQNLATYTWNFGNGSTSTLANPSAITFLPRPDRKDTTYIVTLKAMTTCGIRTFTSAVTVRPKPLSIFTPDKTIGCSPLTVSFNNTSPGTNNTYTFDFGDGQTLVTHDNQPVVHTYTSPTSKTYVVKMTADNECGTSTTQYNIRISPNTVLPQLVVDGDQKAGCAPWTVQFHNNTKGGTYFTYDFGDGTTLATLNAPEVVTHTFLKDGIFNVKLTATNGCADTSTYQSITVFAQPKTNFTADVQSGCTQLTVNFTNKTIGDNTYNWDFGDGSTSKSINPTHTFTAREAPYTISLIARNGLGCTDTMVMKDYINVLLPPKAAFIVKPDSVIAYPYYSFSFADKSTNNPILWIWRFGDGRSESKQNPEHTYRDTGSYTVKLIVYNVQACADSVTRVVRITGVPGQLFVPNAFMPTSKFNEVVTFKAKGSGIKTWRMRVFNKWGQVIWETTKLTDRGEPAEGWDGIMNGAPAPQGVYVWQIEATYINGSEWKGMSYKGSAPSKTGVIHLIQ